MTRPRIERVPADYRPRYPQRLDQQRFEELIAPDQRFRIMKAAAAAASLSLGAQLAAQDGGDKGGSESVVVRARSEAVLQVLSKATGSYGMWFQRTTFRRARDRQQHLQVIPHIPISFGNSQTGVFDAERARSMVKDLFVAYGLKPELDHVIKENGVEARLDVYDAALQIGTKLRGKMPEENGMFAQAKQEVADTDLDENESAALAKAGARVHSAQVGSYPRMDGDEATPTFAYLAAIVAFLNEATAGPDIDLNAVLDNKRVRASIPKIEPVEGVKIERNEHFTTLLASRDATEVVIQFGESTAFEALERAADRRLAHDWSALQRAPGPGAIRLLQLEGAQVASMRIDQSGAPPVHIDAVTASAFLPPRFSPRRPFQLTLKLEANKPCRLPAYVTLVGPTE